MKLQQTIQERLSNIEKIKLSVDLSGENPKEAWAENKELIRQLEEEISELQSRNSELEQLSQTEDDLRFLQVSVKPTKHKSLNNIAHFGLIRRIYDNSAQLQLTLSLSCLYRGFYTLLRLSDWTNTLTNHLQASTGTKLSFSNG